LTIQGSDAKVAYKLVFTEVAGEVHGDHFHDLADKEKVEPIAISFDERGQHWLEDMLTSILQASIKLN
jgi:hypothetical protein